MRILVCEEEEILMTALEFRLQKRQFKLTAVRDGDSAIEALEKNLPDLFVTDLRAKGTEGIELLRYVRKVMQCDIPVIFIAESSDEDLILTGLQEGATDFVLRPFRPAELVLRIRSILKPEEV